MTEHNPDDGPRDGLHGDPRVDPWDGADEDWRDDRPDELLEDEPLDPPPAAQPDHLTSPRWWRAVVGVAGAAGLLALVWAVVTLLRRRLEAVPAGHTGADVAGPAAEPADSVTRTS